MTYTILQHTSKPIVSPLSYNGTLFAQSLYFLHDSALPSDQTKKEIFEKEFYNACGALAEEIIKLEDFARPLNTAEKKTLIASLKRLLELRDLIQKFEKSNSV
jgi:glutaredoxin-related protein